MLLFDKIRNNEVYTIAEMSANHAGSLENALEIARAAKKAGADCLKIQTYTADTLTIPCDNEYFRITKGPWKGMTLYELYLRAYTPWDWHQAIKDECEKLGLDFLSTPYDRSAVDFLERLGVEFYKIASFELVDIPLIEYAASKGKPLILSCGMASPKEIGEALEASYAQGNRDVVLLKCCSEYPANDADMNLAAIADLKRRFGVPVGFSDHSEGDLAAAVAVSLGACVIEKHFCVSRQIQSPDSHFSMEPSEFERMVENVRRAKKITGNPTYELSEKEKESMIFRRSVFTVKDIEKGERFTADNIRVIRPGYGLKPKYYRGLLGMKAGRAIAKGQPVLFDAFGSDAVILLTNNDISMDVYRWLQERENVFLYGGRLTPELVKAINPSFIISYNYRHIIGGDIIEMMGGRMINLHISLLPWNRGASPNFFSFYDHTPQGVTIHMIDQGIDTGDILCQSEACIDEDKESFASSYMKLHRQIQELFYENWEDIRRGRLKPRKQLDDGTFHTVAELKDIRQRYPFDWNDNISAFRNRHRL